jgi:hypothetical protein
MVKKQIGGAQFSVIAIVIAVILLIILIIAYTQQYMQYRKDQQNKPWPPYMGACPDYWVKDGENCTNPNKIGGTDNGCDRQALNQLKTDGEKCNLSKKCNSPWEGLGNCA